MRKLLNSNRLSTIYSVIFKQFFCIEVFTLIRLASSLPKIVWGACKKFAKLHNFKNSIEFQVIKQKMWNAEFDEFYIFEKQLRIQICKYANMQICKYANMQICKYANIQICKYANMQICKYANMQIK